MPLQEELALDGERLWHTLEVSSGIGVFRQTGLRRLALTDEDKTMRDVFVGWARDAGCQVGFDRVGNIFARRVGEQPELPAVCIGSHFDTQICGGRYDGILGVLCGLEIIRTLNDHKVSTRRSIEVVSWTNEEGVRFPLPMQGSGAFCGQFSIEDVLKSKDSSGVSFGEEVTRIGYAGDITRRDREYDSYFELHIEQGPRLDKEGLDVGIVSGGYKSFGYRIDITGETAHCGPTPMELRRNAIVGAGRIIAAIDDIGWKYAAEDGKTSTSHVSCFPGIPGILSETARVNIDLRHPDPVVAERMRDEALIAIKEQAARANVVATATGTFTFGDPGFSPELVALLQAEAAKRRLRAVTMQSQAGHDAYNFASIAPTVMLFTPCTDGISHNVREDIQLERTLPGANLLLHAVLSRACR